MIGSPLNAGPDLDDPAVLAREAESLAGGMQQQANMAQTGTAMGGHPNPGWLYGHVSRVLAKCAEVVKQVAAFPAANAEGIYPNGGNTPSPSFPVGYGPNVTGIDGVLPPQQGAPAARLTVVDTSPEAAAKPAVDDEGVPEPPPVADAPARRGRPPKAKADEQPVG